ncbi:hypothetical protein IWQ60_002577 [Tieghemiomyces parasiticus]|uniref:HMG box domain-containing protein n=1 Tax=Tieghemiomyces parasiticus TaxID=78921 RepID=A0A9W8AH70_9FUNG|nr:hypothetical protein IWQ60_002577 [Tieghemiomyces parasiticus]
MNATPMAHTTPTQSLLTLSGHTSDDFSSYASFFTAESMSPASNADLAAQNPYQQYLHMASYLPAFYVPSPDSTALAAASLFNTPPASPKPVSQVSSTTASSTSSSPPLTPAVTPMSAPTSPTKVKLTAKRAPRTRTRSSPDHIPRPRNAFIIYRQEKHRDLVATHTGPSIPNKDISKIIGRMWKEEAELVKDEYRRRAEDEKNAHATTYPDYKYCPRKSKNPKKLRLAGTPDPAAAPISPALELLGTPPLMASLSPATVPAATPAPTTCTTAATTPLLSAMSPFDPSALGAMFDPSSMCYPTFPDFDTSLPVSSTLANFDMSTTFDPSLLNLDFIQSFLPQQ